MLKRVLFITGRLFSIFSVFSQPVRNIKTYLYSGFYSARFKSFGKGSVILPFFQMTRGMDRIKIGCNCILGHNLQLTVWKNEEYNDAEIIIGSNTAIGDNSHITAYNRIIIGNNVLMGKRILITDNAHGASKKEILDEAPSNRPIVSKGPVIIEDNVWIGEKVSVMPGVRIGKGSIIGANSVVTNNIPPYCVAAGIPAIIKKQL